MVKPVEVAYVENCLELLSDHIRRCGGLAKAVEPLQPSQDAFRQLLEQVLQSSARSRGSEVSVVAGGLEAMGTRKLLKVAISCPGTDLDVTMTVGWAWDMILQAKL